MQASPRAFEKVHFESDHPEIVAHLEGICMRITTGGASRTLCATDSPSPGLRACLTNAARAAIAVIAVILVPGMIAGTVAGAGSALLSTTPIAAGDEGCRIFRIPAGWTGANQPVFAFAEGRVESRQARSDVDIVLRRSLAGGQTWGPMQVVAVMEGDFCGNPGVVQDFGSGRIWPAFTRSPGDATGNLGGDGGDNTGEPRVVDVTFERMEVGPETAVSPEPASADHPAAPARVLTLAPGENNPRNSEGGFVTLADGRLMFVYTHFIDGAGDHASASLKARFSDDGGKTWSDEGADVIENTAGLNVMSVSLLRLRNGKIALFYLLKDSLIDCRPQLRLSGDEGRTWSPPVTCITDEVGYYVLNNDRAIQLSSGRLVLPVCLHNGPEFTAADPQGEVMTYLSDDDGQTWRRGQTRLRAHAADGRRWTVQEPGIVELSGGRAMMFVRSDAGSQLLAFSEDGCETWTDLRPSDIISPLSAASIKRIPSTGDLLLVWNNHANAPAEIRGKRTPLTAAISRDEGKSWENIQTIWDDPHRHYCYIAIHFIGDQVLLGHCAGDRRDNNGLAESQITIFPVDWLSLPAVKER